MKAPAKTSLDENEKKLVDQSKTLEGFTHRELTELARQLRSRRERILRMIRGRKREARQQGALSPDTGAHDKKAELSPPSSVCTRRWKPVPMPIGEPCLRPSRKPPRRPLARSLPMRKPARNPPKSRRPRKRHQNRQPCLWG